MRPYTYLLIDLFSVLLPFLFSFHPRIQLYRKWPALLPAILLTTTVYAVWDERFTRLGIWGFSPQYLSGMHVAELPIEELLFFICIPYACLFSYECMRSVVKLRPLANWTALLSYLFAAVLLVLACLFNSRSYSLPAFAVLSGMILFCTAKKAAWLSAFYQAYLLLLIPFFLVNGLLTGFGLSAPIVWYSASAITGLRLWTIPVEDIFYGMGLILANVAIYELILGRQGRQADDPGR